MAKKAVGGANVVGVKVRWLKGFGERVVDGLIWNAGNGYVVTVNDAAMVERLLKNGGFEIGEAEVEAVEHGAE